MVDVEEKHFHFYSVIVSAADEARMYMIVLQMRFPFLFLFRLRGVPIVDSPVINTNQVPQESQHNPLTNPIQHYKDLIFVKCYSTSL